ncbi:hypothetical protein AYR56_10070 [Loigolactobacillus backii]|uniref:Cobalamin-independent methionine synthase MetE C-terminal/archaeal domain-containing protein n=1 Tax=Loigolactobacillus backii TaxID=375175 RepID=A0A192H2R6_9LACO|nr:cobalamin-independent methionine synthase II family protein [Loigolactobacillus backii]ANK62522.1 hypothetical protein AYR53_06930 [Loigolactobacillus backii]ANK70468.1 hypothetical protein AYR56_10070 [Loigolactobacillus backii]
MTTKFPLFPVSMVGSWPRNPDVLAAIKAIGKPDFSQASLDAVARQQEISVIKMEEQLGLDVISDGELNRDNYASYVAQRFDGIELMDMLRFSDVLGSDCSFADELINRAGVKLSAINNAVCVGKLGYAQGLTVEDLQFLKQQTKQPVKIELPGPYLLARSIWVPNASMPAYKNQEEMAEDILKLLTKEVQHLQAIGVDIIQIDEPVLTEIVFSAASNSERSFMCSSLSKKRDKADELAFATDLIKRLFAQIDRSKSIAALHTCRGNWGTDENAMLSGSYAPLVDTFNEISPDLLFLEFSVKRAGDISELYDNGLNKTFALGIGSTNPRSSEIENPYDIMARVEKALQYLPKEKIWLNPDCGFGTFSNSVISNAEVAERKMRAIVRAAKLLRKKYQE